MTYNVLSLTLNRTVTLTAVGCEVSCLMWRQIQAFGIKNNSFGYSNDCIGFFTVPIWMGVITMTTMLAIVLLGIGMLLSINTMDRYDDPKGKTITVTATE